MLCSPRVRTILTYVNCIDLLTGILFINEIFCIFTLNVKKRSFVMSVMIFRSKGEKYGEDGFWRMCLCNKCAENPFMNRESSWSSILHFLIQYLHFHNGRKHFNTCSVRQQNYQRPNMKCNFFSDHVDRFPFPKVHKSISFPRRSNSLWQN